MTGYTYPAQRVGANHGCWGQLCLDGQKQLIQHRMGDGELFVYEACNLKLGAGLSNENQVVALVNKNHGRRKKLTLWANTEPNDYLDWPDVQQVFLLE